MARDVVRVDDGRAERTESPAAAALSAAAAHQAADENFPVALRLLPRRYRRHLAALYSFARTVDDMGDRAPAEQRIDLLEEVAADLDRLYRSLPVAPGGGEPTGTPAPGRAAGRTGDGPRLSVVRALAPAVAQCAIPAQLFFDLVQANRQDQVVTRYESFEDLAGYCRLSANPVGRIVLHIFGAVTADREVLSDHVCTALQIVEHVQDVAEDLRSGRIYLPVQDMGRFGCSEGDLAAPSAAPQVRALIAFEVRRARALLDQGAPLVAGLRGAARVAVAGYVAGGRAALAAIAASDHDVLRATPRPGKGRVAAEMLRAYATGR